MGSSRTSFTLNVFLPPKASQRPTKGAFFSSESAEKNRTRWSTPKRVFNSSEVFKPCRCGFKQGVHATPGRSPLTAASRQCSRRPARHVVIRSQFSPSAFLRIDIQRHHENRNSASTLNITEADRGGVFFERKRRKKSHRMVGQSVTAIGLRVIS